MSQPEISTIMTLVAGVIVVVVMLMLAVTDFVGFLAFAILIGVITFVLYHFGFVTFKVQPKELDITYHINPFAKEKSMPAPIKLEEVFYISDNKFTYEQAPLVCKAYGAELASYAQVEQAYTSGAEWCGYGWSEGSIALFPTQQATWDKLQKDTDPAKRIKCGRPGVNGGYFDPKTRFGVNCYGVRPTKPATSPVPSTDPAIDKMLTYIKKNLDSFVVQPFNQKMWSENPVMNIQAAQTSTPLASPVPGSTPPTTTQMATPAPPAVTSTLLSSSPTTTSRTSASAAAGSVTQAPPSTTASASTTTTTTGTDPMGILTDTFNSLGSSASNFVQGL